MSLSFISSQSSASSYAVPIAISLLLHGLLIAFVLVGWQSAEAPKQRVIPRYVEATLVTLKPKAEKPKKAKSTQKVVDLTAKRREQARLKAAAKKKRLAKEKAERERLRKLAEDKQRKLDAEQKKQQALAEQKRQALLKQQAQQKLAQEAAFAEALAEEESIIDAQQQKDKAQGYVALLAQRIEQNWSRPPSARRGMKCELQIKLVPTGEVINVTIIKSSGNSAFDRSAEQAVKKVGRFDELREVPSDLFEQYFRQLTLVFNPQDLRL
ncbi:MAG: cell envelope integrity protein TolA [Cellvibrionaceae bacterium]